MKMKTLPIIPLRLMQLLLLWLLPHLSSAQWKLAGRDCAFPAGKQYFNTIADGWPVTDADLDKPSKKGPRFVKPPAHAAELAASEQAYIEGRFAEAAALLKPFITPGPVAPSVLSQNARSLYRVENAKPQSYVAYQRLIAMLDAYGREDAATVSIYLPFSEAYYKLATMQMDNAKWEQAAYNFSRFLCTLEAVPAWKTNEIYESALQYQTECFAELGNTALCRYYGQLTLKYFPQNQYVRPYLAHLPKLQPKPKVPARSRNTAVPHR